MRVFLDTKSTSLGAHELLSVGLVSELGHECYAELDLEHDVGKRRVATSSDFTRQHVLSQWSREPSWSINDYALGLRAAHWLHALIEDSRQDVEFVYLDKADADLLEGALKGVPRWWPLVESRLHWSIVSYLREESVFEAAMATSWEDSRTIDGLKQHHALADARALAAGFKAMYGVKS